jgi:cAMP-dependent protein kinase regulator
MLLERPDQLPQFMIKWLTEHSNKPAPTTQADTSQGELEKLKTELKELKEEVERLEDQVGTKDGGEAKDKKDEEESEEEEEDDDAETEMPPPPTAYMAKARSSVSAEAYGKWNERKAFTPPVYEKTEVQQSRINKVLMESFMFSSVEAKDMKVLIGAMQECTVEPGMRLIEQGDDGECLYVIEEGQMNCFKKLDGEEKLVKECKASEAFGELALLYNCPRAASVVAHEKCVLWKLDRETFNYIVRDATTKRHERYEEFLKGVPILKTMEAYERNAMCDALQVETFAKGATVVKQGDSGDKFYIVEEGDLVVEKVYVAGTPSQEVMNYKGGDYFGELALIRNEPRAATVVAKTDCRLLSLTRRTFMMMLGPLEDILRRNAETQYK